ncbi:MULTISPECIES: HNH endonuclease signature motif containing protein [Kitasatospora]|uniref:HNH endonuclease signature motif containing protein n=1 Tax=Kitasatospora TaxID=2063 RepID=UPI000526FEDB|nr:MULTISPECIES: HNH endonuclease signature motif containing protein [Kitasatospora]
MSDRPELPESLKRDLALEVGFTCPFQGCQFPVQDRCHIIDHAKGGPDVFGNLLSACSAHHRMHTLGQITSQDLRVIKARLAWESDRYTGTETTFLSLFAQNHGTYFAHPAATRTCLRNLVADGYIERVESGPDAARESAQGRDLWHLTEVGRHFARAWAESKALQNTFHGSGLRARPGA